MRQLKFIIYLALAGLVLTGFGMPRVEVLAKNSDSYWTVAIYGDNRSGHAIHKQVIDIVVNESNLEFIINSGDLVNQGGEQEQWDTYLEIVENVSVPIYPVIGNHEKYTSTWGVYDETYQYYFAYAQPPGNATYYSIDQGYIHFVFLSTEHYFNDTSHNFQIIPEQSNWLINDLNTTEKSFIVVTCHRPLYGLRADRYEQAESIRETLEPIFQEYGVIVVFQGHDHSFYTCEREGINYFVAAGGGAPLYDLPDPNELPSYQQGEDTALKEYHYIRMQVRSDSVKFETVLLNQTIAYRLVLDVNGETLEEWSVIHGPFVSDSTQATSQPTQGVNAFSLGIFSIAVSILLLRRRNK